MTNETGNTTGGPGPGPSGSAGTGVVGRTSSSDQERSAAFASGRVPVDRAAALRAGSVPVPRRFIIWIIVGFAVLGIGGLVGEKLIGTAGVGSVISTPVTTLAGTGGSGSSGPAGPSTTGGVPSTPAAPEVPPVGASPSAVIGLTRLAGKPAPPLSLESQSGAPWRLADAKGKVVVVTFFNSECNDICPVLGREITEADQMLGARRSRVQFVVVNSDPLETSVAPVPPALTQTGLADLANVTFLDGPLTDLSSVWRHYGVTVALDNTTRVITHNDVLYFIDPTGDLVRSASPFADESTLGIYSLQPGVIHTFARGVAETAVGLLGGTP